MSQNTLPTIFVDSTSLSSAPASQVLMGLQARGISEPAGTVSESSKRMMLQEILTEWKNRDWTGTANITELAGLLAKTRNLTAADKHRVEKWSALGIPNPSDPNLTKPQQDEQTRQLNELTQNSTFHVIQGAREFEGKEQDGFGYCMVSKDGQFPYEMWTGTLFFLDKAA